MINSEKKEVIIPKSTPKDGIVQNGDPVLRDKAKAVPPSEIISPGIQKIIKDMKMILSTQEDGIGIAAPQIGISLQIFVVSGAVLGSGDPTYKGTNNFLVFINPSITKTSRKKQEVEEGCLSVRWFYGKTKRAEKVTLKAYDESGKTIERGASGLLAQVFQHEVDHLNGVLFIDKAYDLENIPPEEQKRRKARA